MQCTADFHEQIADARLPQPAGVVDDAAALDAAVDVLDAHATAGIVPSEQVVRKIAPSLQLKGAVV
jgi:hypothetical protein